jgi:hypothetical protein
MKLTAEQIETVKHGLPVRMSVPELEGEVVLMLSSTFEAFEELAADRQEKEAWAKLATDAREMWAQENPF